MQLFSKILIGIASTTLVAAGITIPTVVVSVNKQKTELQNNSRIYFDESSFREYLYTLTNKTETTALFVGDNAKTTISTFAKIDKPTINNIIIFEGSVTEDNFYSLSFQILLNDPYYFVNNDAKELRIENVATRIPAENSDNSTTNLHFNITEDGTLIGLTELGKQQPTLIIPETVTQIQASEVLGEGIFAQSTKLKSVVLPSSIKTIPKYSFAKSTIESIFIPDNIGSLGYGSFEQCKNLKTVTFGANCIIKSIGAATFRSTGLTSITLPQSVTKLTYLCFAACTSLRSVIMLADNVTFDRTDNFKNSTNAKFIVQDDLTKNALLNQILSGTDKKITADLITVITPSSTSSVPVNVNALEKKKSF